MNLIKFGENNNYHHIDNAYLQYELRLERDVDGAANRVPVSGDAIRLVNKAYAYCFKEVRLSTTGGSDMEQNKCVGQVSTIMRALASKNGDLLSRFDKIGESEAEIENTSLHHHPNNNHDQPANKGRINRVFPLENIFRFWKTFIKITNQI